MVKYTIEGNIDFYSELYKSLDDDKTNINDNIDNNEIIYCLISNMPLTENFVMLECGHKFNYEPLFNDLVNHKQKFNNMERCMLKSTDIRCPYCRKVQHKLLPYYEDLGFEKVHGVNYLDSVKILNDTGINKWEIGQCCFMALDLSGNEGVSCINQTVTTVEPTGKKYCYVHKYIAYHQYVKQKKMEIKQKIKEEKMKIKLAEKEKKLLEKQLSKSKTKKETIINMNDNVIISGVSNLCNQLLKTGPNKGKECGCKVYKDNFCKRHFPIEIVATNTPNIDIDISYNIIETIEIIN